ncbi:MAG: hypothetical protein ACI8YQ_004846, partial [Polaribacter sp.]
TKLIINYKEAVSEKRQSFFFGSIRFCMGSVNPDFQQLDIFIAFK